MRIIKQQAQFCTDKRKRLFSSAVGIEPVQWVDKFLGWVYNIAMNKKKNNGTIIPPETSTGLVALVHRLINTGLVALAKMMIKIAQAILSGQKTAPTIDDSWIDELIAWADANNISEKQFPRDRKEIVNRAKLDLTGNKLTQLPESIGHLHNLTMLVLGINNLTQLPESIGHLHNLTSLILGINNLTQLPESIGHLHNLNELDLYKNNLTQLPESIGHLRNLHRLDLRNNPIKKFPPELAHLNNIVEW